MTRFLFVMCCLLCALIGKSQAPVAEFSASVTSGCAPLVVTFKDLSSGNPKFWNWDFSNGQLTNQQNPTIAFTQPGKYSVTLVVRNADGTDGETKEEIITVNPSPLAQFTASLTTACAPALISFRDASVANAGVITKWEWDFGDGTTSSVQNPDKIFTNTGYYTVTLKVTSSTGCTHTNSQGRFIRIVPGIKAAFIDSIPPVCRTPINVSFLNETSGPGDLSYSWTFGNGNVSNVVDPVQSFANAGDYNIRLIASSSLGCNDTAERKITVNNKLTSFTAPDSSCINQDISFQNGASTAISSTWDFGDQQTSDQKDVIRKFSRPGEYVVKLINSYADCVDSASKRITIMDLPVVNFSSNEQVSCKAPFTVNFQDNSPDAVSQVWNFGDGSPTVTGKNVTHTYTSVGSFEVSLTVTSKFGCVNTKKEAAFIRIVPPTVSIANAPAGGCIPYTFSPVASVNSVDAVTSYAWTLGNGTTSTLASPPTTYSVAGNYNLDVTITTSGGCTASTSVPAGVRTGTPPTVNFALPPSQVCAADSVQFTDNSSPADQWLWEFGDGKTSTLRSPKHAYDSVGVFNVRLTAFNNGCGHSQDGLHTISTTAPLARFRYQTDCNNRLTVNFINESVIDANSPVIYKWEFGDPANTILDGANPTFTYPAIGKYSIKLTITNGSCQDIIVKEIELVSDVADFIADKTTVCIGETVNLTAVGSNPDNVSSYLWTVNGVTAGGRTFPTYFNGSGAYEVILTITDLNGCTDTKNLAGFIKVNGPRASLTPSTDSSCVNSNIVFTDASTPIGNIGKWTVSFGDGTSQTFTTAPFNYAFKDTGDFRVEVRVEDKQGCSQAITLPVINITSPTVKFSAEATTICPELPLQFLDSSSGSGLKYFWEFGDGTNSDVKEPTHAYPRGDKSYPVKLSVTDINGCTASRTENSYIDVRAPKSAFDVKDTITLCPPLETSFFFKGKDYESFYWDFGDGGTSMLENPTHFYNSYGNFTAKLYLSGFGGCLDSSEHQVHVYDPNTSTVSYSPLEACNELLVDFAINTPPGTKFQLVFGDGIDSSQRKTLQHRYTSPSFYQPYILLSDSLDCQVFVGGREIIKILGAEPFFATDRKAFCDSGTVFFTNYTIGNDPVVSDTWDFGDGQTSSLKDPVHSYKVPGTYVVSHIVQTQSGCGKTITDTVRIHRTPDPEISSKDIICINTPELFEGILAVPDTAIKWRWTLGDGQTSTSNRFNHTYTAAGDYNLTVEAENVLGCKANDSKSVTVKPVPLIDVQENPVISGGASVKLPVTYSQNISTYTWTPSTGLDCVDCPNPIAKPKLTTTYKVNVTDSNNCKNQSEITVTVVCNDKNYFVPNTFSPNGDGVNDFFYPRGSSIDKIQSMRIFNRWGELVFEKRNFSVNSQSDGWNGTFRGKPANGDVYVYIIEFICENATVISYKGNIALIR